MESPSTIRPDQRRSIIHDTEFLLPLPSLRRTKETFYFTSSLSFSLSLSLSRSSALHTIDRKSKKSQSAFETHVLRIGSRIANAEPRSCCTTSRNIANTLFSSKRNVRGIIPGGLFPLRFRRVVSGG